MAPGHSSKLGWGIMRGMGSEGGWVGGGGLGDEGGGGKKMTNGSWCPPASSAE